MLIKGKRINDTEYAMRGYMPATALGILIIIANQTLTPAPRSARIKSLLLKNAAGHRYVDGMLVVYEVPDEIYLYERDPEWQIFKVNTTAGGTDTSTVLN